jgi:hypothetical protein
MPDLGQSGVTDHSEQGPTYDADLIADLESKAKRWKGKPWGYLLAEAAARLRELTNA